MKGKRAAIYHLALLKSELGIACGSCPRHQLVSPQRVFC